MIRIQTVKNRLKMNFLFVHQGFPGQYLHICRALAQQGGHRLVALAMRKPNRPLPKGLQLIVYGPKRGNGQGVHPLALETETKVIRAEACAEAAEHLKKQGFTPDIICGHPGWGELLFLHNVWKNVPILMYQEFFYRAKGFDFDFDPELQASLSWQQCAKAEMKNANILLNLESSSWNVTPTRFQRSSFPEHYQDRMTVIHDGISGMAKPASANSGLTLKLKDGHQLNQGDPIVTFVNRSIEPYRGCHSFLRAIPKLQKLHQEAQVVIVGAETGVSYGAQCPNGEWKEYFLREIEGKYDPAKVHFAGNLGYDDFLRILQMSQAHVYLTYPFVLSWSLLEAMSTGCAIVGSHTAPVVEAIQDEHNGLLVDFFAPDKIAEQIDRLLRDRKLATKLGSQARKDALEHYSIDKCLPRQLELIHNVATRILRG